MASVQKCHYLQLSAREMLQNMLPQVLGEETLPQDSCGTALSRCWSHVYSQPPAMEAERRKVKVKQ